MTIVWVGCTSESNDPVVRNGPKDDGFGGGTTGAGIDPAKEASTCYPEFQELELNVATWNIEWFPQNGATSWTKVKDIVTGLGADVIGVQEIANGSQYRLLESGLAGYEAAYADVNYDQELGFIYRREAFKSFSKLTMLFGDDSYNFPRQAVRADAVYANGLEVTFINIHLKCCGGDNSSEQNRRKNASIKLKAYIDSNLPNKAVIVLGDYNDGISASNSPFKNFNDDPTNYRFADMDIATGSSSDFSYPGWPSHLDHILITNELFGLMGNVETIKPETCVMNYNSDVSDHRPVVASFK